MWLDEEQYKTARAPHFRPLCFFKNSELFFAVYYFWIEVPPIVKSTVQTCLRQILTVDF